MTDLTLIREEVDQFLYDFQEVKITTKEEYTNAGDVVKQIQNKIKKLEAKRLEYTRPLDESKKRIMEDFKSITEPLEEFVQEVKAKMLDWYRVEDQKVKEEQARIEKEALEKAKEENKSEVQVPIVADIKTQRGEVSTQTVKKIWKWKPIDQEKIPREYLCIDGAKVAEAIKDGIRKIEGIEIYQEESLSIR